MNEAIHRDFVIRSLQQEANGSFSIIQRALAEEARVNRSHDLDLESVKKRIRKMVQEQGNPLVPAE